MYIIIITYFRFVQLVLINIGRYDPVCYCKKGHHLLLLLLLVLFNLCKPFKLGLINIGRYHCVLLTKFVEVLDIQKIKKMQDFIMPIANDIKHFNCTWKLPSHFLFCNFANIVSLTLLFIGNSKIQLTINCKIFIATFI